jgi:hypothetical protein
MLRKPTTAKPASALTSGHTRRLPTNHREEPPPSQPSIQKSGSKHRIGKSTDISFKKHSAKPASGKQVATLPDKAKRPIKKIGKNKASLTEQD